MVRFWIEPTVEPLTRPSGHFFGSFTSLVFKTFKTLRVSFPSVICFFFFDNYSPLLCGEQAGIVKKEHIKIHGFWAAAYRSPRSYYSLCINLKLDC